MNKGNITEELAKIVGSKNKAHIIVDSIFSQIKDALKKKDIFILPGFGSFKVVRRKARKGRNHYTGESMEIKAGNVLKFSAGKVLKEAVNSVRD